MKRLNEKLVEKIIGNERYVFTMGWTKFEGQEPYFSITGQIDEKINNKWKDFACGSLHADFENIWPELAHLVKYHLCSTKGPMHYLSNSIYLASNRDHWGKLKGEEKSFKTSIRFNDVPILFEKYSEKFIMFLQCNDAKAFVIRKIEHKPDASYKWEPKFTFDGFGKEWHDCPFDNEQEAKQFLLSLLTCKVEYIRTCDSWGEGKEPDLKAARNAAIWPDAQLSDFTKEKLTARLPELMAQFKKDLLEAGIAWPDTQEEQHETI